MSVYLSEHIKHVVLNDEKEPLCVSFILESNHKIAQHIFYMLGNFSKLILGIFRRVLNRYLLIMLVRLYR